MFGTSKTMSTIRDLEPEEIESVSGGLDAETGGLAIIGLGALGSLSIALFAIPIGLALLYVANAGASGGSVGSVGGGFTGGAEADTYYC